MSFLTDSGIMDELDPFGDLGNLTGRTAAEAAENAAISQDLKGREALALLDPFQVVGQQGLGQAGILTDPNQQFDFLQSNPLFDLSLQNANRRTDQRAASRGRLSAGDTLEQLSNNVLLSSQPLLDRQTQSVRGLLDFGQNVAGNQGNLLTGLGANQAAGQIGAANARTQGTQNTAGLIGGILGMFSDPVLKENIVKVSEINITKKGEPQFVNIYTWDWNQTAKDNLGLEGPGRGVMADEIQLSHPDAVKKDKSGFLKVDYTKIK